MDDRLGRDEWIARLRKALESAGAPEADVYVRRLRRGFARYSLNTLNQHAELDEETATARVGVKEADGYRLASISTTDTRHDSLVRAIRRAADVAAAAPIIPAWPGFAAPEGEAKEPPRFSQATADCDAGARADLVAPALAQARDAGLTAAGALDTTLYEIALANTAGVQHHTSGTTASFRMFALDRDGVSGFAQAAHRDVSRLDVSSRAREACEKSLAGKNGIALPAGEYDVLLEPPAVVELLEWLSFIALGAREVFDGTSVLAGHEGQSITGPAVTLVDDACDSSDLGFGVPFDRDGILRQRVTLIDCGVAGKPVYDRLFAARLGARSTGHAGPPGGFDDAPIAQALMMEPGHDTLESLTAKIQRGLHITRFHYCNGFLDPRRTLMTGLTRDGTFLIENGVRTRGVRNMRFTDSVMEAFGRIDGMTAVRQAVPTWWSEAGAFSAPAILIRGFRFTGGGVERPA